MGKSVLLPLLGRLIAFLTRLSLFIIVSILSGVLVVLFVLSILLLAVSS